MRDVLGGVVAPLLIVGAAVSRTKVERIVRLVVRLQPKRNADEPAGTRRRVRCRSTSELDFDHSVRELEVADPRELLELTLLALRLLRHRHAQSVSPLQ